jgi:WD40 repeat protein
MWGNFENRFNSILASLAYHRDLVDQQAVAVNIVETTQHRLQQMDQWEKIEKDRQADQLFRVRSWLQSTGNIGIPQEDELDRISGTCLPDSCKWMVKHPTTEIWIRDSSTKALVWLFGKPGAGKTVLCSALVQFLQSQNIKVLYYFCSYRDIAAETSISLLRSLASQAIQYNPDLAAYIHDEYVQNYPVANLKALKDLVPKLLNNLGSSRIVIDGIDEHVPQTQGYIIDDILRLMSTDSHSHICKVLLASRDVLTVSRKLRRSKAALISLTEEHQFIDRAIENFVEWRLSELKQELQELDPGGSVLRDTQGMLIKKAEGMFLWVSLMLKTLETVYSLQDLHDILQVLPPGLPALYTHILSQVCDKRDPRNYERVTRMLMWICYSRRPLRKFELLPGLAFTSDTTILNSRSLPNARIMDLCKPLIEERPDGCVTFVHFSVQEFLMSSETSSMISSIDAHRNILLAATATMMSGFELIAPNATEEDILVQTGSGIFGLIPYATEHWIEHLLSYASAGGPLEPDHLVPSRLSNFQTRHDQLACSTQKRSNESASVEIASMIDLDQIDNRIGLLAHLPIRRLITRVFEVRQLTVQKPCQTGQEAEAYALNYDPTVFSQLKTAFDRAVLNLLSREFVPGLSEDQLDTFKEYYASSAFRCRYRACSNASIGFPSDELRTQHENTHQVRFFCPANNCPWNRIGFKTKKGLSSHMRTHENKAKSIIPAKVRRFADSPDSPDDGHSPQSPKSPKSPTTDENIVPLAFDPNSPDDGRSPQSSMSRTTNEHIVPSELDPESEISRLGNNLADLDINTLPAEYIQKGSDWHAIFNPRFPRELDIELVQDITAHEPPDFSVDFSFDGDYIATCSGKSAIIFYSVSGVIYNRLEHDCSVYIVRFGPDGRYLATGADDGTVRVWRIQTASMHHTFPGHSPGIAGIEFSSDGQFLASCVYHGEVYLWDVTTGQHVRKFEIEDKVCSVSVSSDNRYIAAGGMSGIVFIWDLNSGKLIDQFKGYECHQGSVRSVKFAPGDKELINASDDQTVKVWEMLTSPSDLGLNVKGRTVKTFYGHKDIVNEATQTTVGDYILSTSDDRGVHIWDLASGAVRVRLVGHNWTVYNIASHPTDNLFATVGDDRKLRIWRYSKRLRLQDYGTRNKLSDVQSTSLSS